jgi:hypothetical protein
LRILLRVIILPVSNISVENGKLKIVGTASAEGNLAIQKNIALDLSTFAFLSLSLTSSNAGWARIGLYSGGYVIYKFWENTRFSIAANTETRYNLPILSPVGTNGSNAFSSWGEFSTNTVTRIVAGIGGLTSGQEVTFYLDNITADTAKTATIELQTPDNLSATSLSLYTHNGTAYQLCSTHSLDGAYSQVSQTSANCTFLDGTKLDDVYGIGAGRAVFPKGSAAATVNGSTGSLTYSEKRGTDKRIGLKFNLPPSDNGRTNFNKVRAKLVINYTDTVGNIVPDLSGNNNTGTIVGGVTKLNDGGLRFYSAPGEITVTDSDIFTFDSFSLEIKFKWDGIRYSAASTNDWGTLVSKGKYDAGEFTCLLHRGSDKTDTNVAFFINGVNSATWENSIIDTDWHTYKFTYDKQNAKIYYDGVLKSTGAYTSSVVNTTNLLRIGASSNTWYKLGGDVEYFKFYNVSDPEPFTIPIVYYNPTVSNMGSTTYQFSDTTSASTGLQNLSKPWIALYDPTSNLIDFYLFTHRPKNLEFRRDESGNIYELVLYPGNGLIYHGQITYPDLTLDSDSNLIPNFLEESIEGSLTKFLKSYGMVI